MKTRRRKITTETASSMSGQILGLSLFIMLLAFFIVLNAISSYEETRVKPVMQSLETAFSSKVADRTDLRPSAREDLDTFTGDGDTLENLEALFSAQIPSHEATVSHSKGVMYVRVPFDDFEAAVMAIGQEDATEKTQDGTFLNKFFLPTLVSLLKTEDVGTPYRMDIMLNIKGNPAYIQNQNPQRLSQIMKKMSLLSEKIENAGLPQKLLSTGLQKGEVGIVELLFRRHIPFNPLGPEKNGEE